MELVKDGQGKRVSFTSDHHAIGPQDSCGTRERYDLHSSGHRHQASLDPSEGSPNLRTGVCHERGARRRANGVRLERRGNGVRFIFCRDGSKWGRRGDYSRDDGLLMRRNMRRQLDTSPPFHRSWPPGKIA